MLHNVCVKMVGVQSGSLSQSLQYSTGLCCPNPSEALADIHRAQMEVNILHSKEGGYVINFTTHWFSSCSITWHAELLDILREI